MALARAAASWAGVIGWKGTEPLAWLPPAESSDCRKEEEHQIGFRFKLKMRGYQETLAVLCIYILFRIGTTVLSKRNNNEGMAWITNKDIIHMR